jgi:hypothetical protein
MKRGRTRSRDGSVRQDAHHVRVRSRGRWSRTAVAAASLFVLVIALAPLAALAQDTPPDPQPDQDRLRDRLGLRDGDHDGAPDADRLQVRQRLQDCIDGDARLNGDQRREMRRNLEAGLTLGLAEADLAGVFPTEGRQERLSPQTMLRLQERVLTLAREGLPAEALLAKVQEGRIKQVPEPALENAAARVEEHVRAASRVMARAAADGLEQPADPRQERQLVRGMARQLWSGLDEGDLDQLRQRARDRRQDGSCTLEDLEAAAETAAQLHEGGLSRERAVRMAGEALAQGYQSRQMHEIRALILAGQHQGRGVGELADAIESCLEEGMAFQYMWQHMEQAGWLEPGGMHGPGGYQHGDEVGGGPGDHHQGEPGGGHGHDGGSGSDPGDMGGGPDGGMGGSTGGDPTGSTGSGTGGSSSGGTGGSMGSGGSGGSSSGGR